MGQTHQNTNRSQQQNRENQAPSWIAYHVTDRGEKAFWTRIGAAWDHEDGKGMSVDLDLVPAAGGRIVLRTNEPIDSEYGQESV